MDGTLDGTTKAAVGANGLACDVKNASIAVAAGSVASSLLGVQGPTARDAAIAALPVTIGGRAATTPQADVDADGDVVNARFDRHGCLFVQVHEAIPAGTNAIGKLAANSGVDIGDVDVLSLPAATVAGQIQWSHYSNDYSTTQTSTDLVAANSTNKFYIGRITIGTGGTTAGIVTVYFGTGAYSAGSSKTVFRANMIPSATASPGVVIGDGGAPFCISAASDALKITTSAAMTVYVQVDYIRV